MASNFQFFIFICFGINAVMAVNFTFRFALEKKPKNPLNTLILWVTISSAIWSIGMGMMSIQTNLLYAYIWRIIGILGTFIFMMSVQKTICYISDIDKKIQTILNGISYLGLFVYILYIRPGQTIFVINEIGTTFYFAPGITSIIYSLYYTVVCIDIFAVTVYTLRKHKLQKSRIAAKRFIAIEFLIFVGAIFDMILPVLGYPALPGSAITHFWGVFVLWFVIHDMYNSMITISNMSQYIYYSVDIPVLVFDSDYKLQISNDAFQRFTNLNESVIASNEPVISNYFEAGNNIFQFEGNGETVRAVCKANQANCDLSISKIKDKYNDVIGYIIVVNDLTEHEQVIRKLEQAKLEADSANMAKSLFLTNMSHQIRTPLNAIIGFSQLALKENVDEHAKEYFNDINNSGNALLIIISDILHISEIELGKQELKCSDYSTSVLFREIETMVSIQAKKKNLELSMDIMADFPAKLNGDRDKIREILINILNNSVKYTNEGKITFKAEYAMNDDKNITLTFKITDTGIGITKEDQAHIFDKFHRVDAKLNSSTEGTGLGLSITKGFVELMKGQISVESEYGKGSTFTVVIPQTIAENKKEETEAKADSSAKVTQTVDYSNLRALIVDDNAINLKVASAVLKRYGIAHDTVNSGQASIDSCQSNTYNLVLMDQMMPEMDGVEAMKRIHQLPKYQNESVPVIVALTANVIEGARESLLAAGFDGYLSKPLNLKALEEVLSKL